ncbi:peptidyl-prolyl cis-trans isomerase [Lentibacillus sp. CBA3610]|uniref:peptidylprolyl isomerase n=1 Tax=Lentibacillus sp. CBA3610 TaxID=2518176 RepID=UPI0015955A92|nr:peptidyl-prolyl cis-trans isomerase [Lentibacillus sp. CBA3610]QKY70912.1 protein secretion protein [Lentibacillus sp. CBA3610]
MNKKLLWGMIVVLLITNITTLIFWGQTGIGSIDGGNMGIDQTEPVASVGDQTISYDEWITALRENNGENQLKHLINQQVVQQLADANNVTIDEKIIAREIALLTTMQGVMTEEETNRKEAEWREDIIHRYQLEALLTADANIPDEDIRSYYEDYRDQYDVQASTQISHIVVDGFETAEKVHTELENGASFSLLAQEYSIDDETKDEGGYFGFLVNTSQFWPAGYLDKVEEMEERTYSEPFQSNENVVIIYLHRKLPPITFDYEEMKPYVERELAMDELDQSLSAESLWDELDVEWMYEE